MQTTKISAFSLKQVLRQNVAGMLVAGYTVKPGFSNGLFIYSKQDRKAGQYVGF